MPILKAFTTSEHSVFQTFSRKPQPSTYLPSLLITKPRFVIAQQPASSDMAIPRDLHSQSSHCHSKLTRRWSTGARHDHNASQTKLGGMRFRDSLVRLWFSDLLGLGRLVRGHVPGKRNCIRISPRCRGILAAYLTLGMRAGV